MGYNLHPLQNPDGTLPDLRQRTIARIKTEGLFNMAFWSPGEFPGARRARNVCETACCLAGNICLAAFELGLEGSPIDKVTCVSEKARKLWASQYGEDEARRLDFLGSFSHKSSMYRITAEEVIDHLDDVRERACKNQ